MPRPHKSFEPNKLNVFNSKTEWNKIRNPYPYELTVLGVGSMPQNSGIWRIRCYPAPSYPRCRVRGSSKRKFHSISCIKIVSLREFIGWCIWVAPKSSRFDYSDIWWILVLYQYWSPPHRPYPAGCCQKVLIP